MVLGLDGRGNVERFADYSQWEAWQGEKEKSASKAPTVSPNSSKAPTQSGKKKLSYAEAREYDAMETNVAAAEEVLDSKRIAVQAPEITKDGRLLEQAFKEMEAAQAAVDKLYERWAELETKLT